MFREVSEHEIEAMNDVLVIHNSGKTHIDFWLFNLAERNYTEAGNR